MAIFSVERTPLCSFGRLGLSAMVETQTNYEVVLRKNCEEESAP